LESDLLSKIQSLDTAQLLVKSIYDRVSYVKSLRQHHELDWLTILKEWSRSYGFMFSQAGTIKSLELPKELEQELLTQLSAQFSQSVINDCIVRLQLVYGGQLIPPHVDIRRSASLVYPVSNHSAAHTVFYQPICAANKTQQLFRLCDLEETARVVIDQYPVLFDTNIVHSVMYSTIPKAQPRLSISIKWRSLTVNQILAGSNCI
jgi:hypothetical protein